AASITRPHHGAQAALCQSILNTTGTDPNDIDYIEMHGTGTQAGDYHEIMSVSEVFAPSIRPHPIYVGTVKANIGHGEASAGVMSLIKVLMMLQKKMIPPHVGIQTGVVNERFPPDLKERNIRIPMTSIPWVERSEGSKRLVFLNNFSAAGGNTAMLLQEAPTKVSTTRKDPRKHFVVNVSGKNAIALKKNLENLADYVAKNPDIRLSDLSYTATARRMTFACRSAVTGSDLPTIEKELRAAAGAQFKPIKPKNVAFVFTGQGRIYAELGRSLFETSSFFRNRILQFERLSTSLGLPMFTKMIDGTLASLEQESPLVVQLGTVCVQMALNDLINALGVEPVAVIGHSLGEYAASYAAGLLPAVEVIRLVGVRAKMMVDICEKGAYCMLAVKASESVVRSFAEDNDIACINAPEETVLAGRRNRLMALQQILDARGLRTKLLDVPYAFHSAQMVPAADVQGRYTWDSRDTWYRQTDVVANPRDLVSLPVMLHKPRAMIDIGRCTTIVFQSHLSTTVKTSKLSQLLTFLEDINIQSSDAPDLKISGAPPADVWKWLNPSAGDSDVAPSSSLNDLASQGYMPLPFSVRYQLEVCLSHGFLSEFTLCEDFVKRLANLSEPEARSRLEHVALNKKVLNDPMVLFDMEGAFGPSEDIIPYHC
ncbi:putative PKS/NRPS-like protein biosynthetic cluster, partial [Ascosphaera pollenicola]